MPEWKYLLSRSFQSRYVLAAWLLNDVPNVVEIGSYMTPISHFLDLDRGDVRQVVAFDPKTSEMMEIYKGLRGNVDVIHYSEPLAFDGRLPEKDYGVAILGLELHLTEVDWGKLLKYLNGARKVVLEYPLAHPHSVTQYARIVNGTRLRAIFQVTMEFANNDFGDLTNSAPPLTERRVVCLEPKP